MKTEETGDGIADRRIVGRTCATTGDFGRVAAIRLCNRRELLPPDARGRGGGRARIRRSCSPGHRARPRATRHVSRSGHEPFRASCHRWRAGADRRGVRHVRDRAGRSARQAGPRRHWRRCECRIGPKRSQDWPGSRIDQRLQNRRHRRQQCLRYVLRDGAQQVSHAGRPARHARRRVDPGYRRCIERGGFPG